MQDVTKLLEMILEGRRSEFDEALEQVRALRGKHAAKSLLEPLLDAARRPHSIYWRRANAIYALGELGERKAVHRLIEILKEGASPSEADEALQDLMTQGPLVMNRRSKSIQTELPEIRAAAAVALGLIGDRKALKALIDALQHDWAWNVQAAAAFGLGELGYKSAAPVLKVVAETNEEDVVRENAQEALKKLKRSKWLLQCFRRFSQA